MSKNAEKQTLTAATLSQISEETIFQTVIDLMISAQHFSGFSGEDKKIFVMKKLKFILGKESYDRYEPILGMSIDLIKSLSKNKHILDKLKNNCLYFSCVR